MKKIVAISLSVCMTILFVITPALAQADNEPIVIPYQVPEDENGDRIVEVAQGQEVALRVRWGACNRGFTRLWQNLANLDWTLDGYPLFGTKEDTSQYWNQPFPRDDGSEFPCLDKTDTMWWTYWTYSIGTLDLGDHPVYLHYWSERPVIDGGDWNGDGRPDRSEVALEVAIIIRVVE